jgi:methionyl-tRNA formyltransferase
VSASIAVAATASFGADVLERLAARHEITCLLTRPDAPAGRGRRLAEPPAKTVAERLGIRVLQPERLAPGLDLEAATVVTVAYGLIVPDSVLEERLWLNVHPSLLPRWRGAAPVERAIMAGDAETGVTIIKLVSELDAGPIAAQEAFAIGTEDDAGPSSAGSQRLVDERCGLPPCTGPERRRHMRRRSRLDRELTGAAVELHNASSTSPHVGARGDARRSYYLAVAVTGRSDLIQPDGGRRMSRGVRAG